MKYPVNYNADGYHDGWAGMAEEAEDLFEAMFSPGDLEPGAFAMCDGIWPVEALKGTRAACEEYAEKLRAEGFSARVQDVWGGCIVEVEAWRVRLAVAP